MSDSKIKNKPDYFSFKNDPKIEKTSADLSNNEKSGKNNGKLF